jgi:site-specific DNA-methyltransferase (adenine-specific)
VRVETIGDATLYCGDAADLVRDLPPVDIVFTDPPYSSGARTDSERQVRGAMLRSMEDADWFSHDAMTTWGFGWFMRSVFSELRQRTTAGAHIYVCIDWRQTPNVYGLLEATGYRVNHCLVWKKSHFGMGAYWRNQHENIVFASNGMPAPMLDRGMGSVIECAAVSSDAREHPTEKPTALIEAILRAVPGDVVLDPFMGSGATGCAALRCGRRFIGCEINPHHYETSLRRIGAANKQRDMFVHTPPPSAPNVADMFA